MARTPSVILADLLARDPDGCALPRDVDSVWAAFQMPIAAEWARVEETAEALLPEIDPRTTVYLLPDWQRLLGPDPYGRDAAALDLTYAQEQQLAWVRLTAGGNMAPSDYVALAASMGVTITIREYWISQCGQAQCGQQLVNAIWDGTRWQQQQFKWLVDIPASLIVTPQCGSAVCDDPLGIADPTVDTVVAALVGEAPSHTQPVFAYS